MASIASYLPEVTVCFRETRSVTGERREALLTLHQRYENVWSATLRAGVKSGQLRSAGTLAVKALLGMHHYSYLWLRPDGPRPPGDIAGFFIELSLHPGWHWAPHQRWGSAASPTACWCPRCAASCTGASPRPAR